MHHLLEDINQGIKIRSSKDNQFKSNIDQVSVLKVFTWLSGIFNFSSNVIEHSIRIHEDPDQMPRSVASELGLHCLPMSHEKDGRLYG